MAAAPPPDSSILNLVVRMVVPMRREFGRSLDVQQFMRDAPYAQLVLDQALTSQDQRLREYAEFVSRHLSGVRQGAAPASRPDPAPASAQSATAPSPAAAPAEPAEPTAAEMRARMMEKYRKGLR